MWRLIAITPEYPSEESTKIPFLLDNGFSFVHIRKPGMPEDKLRSLIEQIPPQYYKRLSLHDHLHLAETYLLGGIHLNQRNEYQKPENYCGNISRSCHSIEEVGKYVHDYDYLFLSPIFDSISKKNYPAKYTEEELKQAHEKKLINHKIIALGGVTPAHFDFLKKLGFGGAAMLGSIWK